LKFVVFPVFLYMRVRKMKNIGGKIMKKLILITSMLLIGTQQVQAMSTKIWTGLTIAAGSAAAFSTLKWAYNKVNEAIHAARNQPLETQRAAINTQREPLLRRMQEINQQVFDPQLQSANIDATADLAELQAEHTRLTNELEPLTETSSQLTRAILANDASSRNAFWAADVAQKYAKIFTVVGGGTALKAGIITPQQVAIAGAATAAVATVAARVQTYRANKGTQDAASLRASAQGYRITALAGGAIAVGAVGAHYLPNAVSTAVTATKVGIGLTAAAGTIALAIKCVPPVINAINNIRSVASSVRSVASWFGA
jgi:hypothetical protein